jgi:hypothetical protein
MGEEIFIGDRDLGTFRARTRDEVVELPHSSLMLAPVSRAPISRAPA